MIAILSNLQFFKVGHAGKRSKSCPTSPALPGAVPQAAIAAQLVPLAL
jgi:hypothetical protein